MNVQRPQRTRDARRANYTDSRHIVEFMVARLAPRAGEVVWEPCAGTGHLADGLLSQQAAIELRLSERDPSSLSVLRRKYQHLDNLSVIDEDVLSIGVPGGSGPIHHVLANPPYGAWLEPAARAELKVRYPDLYVRETYAVFLRICIARMEAGGRGVFIIPDTFLWLHRHEGLRRFLLQACTVEEVVLLSAAALPSAGFGYAGLAILTVVKTPPTVTHMLKIWPQLEQASYLTEHLAVGSTPEATSRVSQQHVSSAECASFCDGWAGQLDAEPERFARLGSLAEVRTGFYSGNDRRWRRRRAPDVRRSKNFADVDSSAVRDLARAAPPIGGIPGRRCFIPMMRGGAEPYVKATDWYIDWSEQAVAEYRKPGRNPARFQNSRFYFKDGIGVPMVASTRLTAALIEGRLIDQSIVGIYPHDSDLLLYLLAFLNSGAAHRQLRSINGTANNSAGYLKRMVVPLGTLDSREAVAARVEQLLIRRRNGEDTAAIEASLSEGFDRLLSSGCDQPCGLDDAPALQ